MRLARFDEGKIGIVRGENIVDVSDACGVDPREWPPTGIVRVVASWDELSEKVATAAEDNEGVPLSEVALQTPIPWPNKLLALPANFRDHHEEMRGRSYAPPAGLTADAAGFFMKANSSLIGPKEAIVLPHRPDREFHHECEMAIVIGRRGRNIPIDRAMDFVFGYACLIDVTLRGHEERVMRKSYDTFTPVGPWITTADEIDDPHELEMKLSVNGELRQQSQPKMMIVGIAEAVSMCSSAATLEPGDLIASGTMSGVGPLHPGDEVCISIDQLGSMTLPVVGEAL